MILKEHLRRQGKTGSGAFIVRPEERKGVEAILESVKSIQSKMASGQLLFLTVQATFLLATSAGGDAGHRPTVLVCTASGTNGATTTPTSLEGGGQILLAAEPCVSALSVARRGSNTTSEASWSLGLVSSSEPPVFRWAEGGGEAVPLDHAGSVRGAAMAPSGALFLLDTKVDLLAQVGVGGQAESAPSSSRRELLRFDAKQDRPLSIAYSECKR